MFDAFSVYHLPHEDRFFISFSFFFFVFDLIFLLGYKTVTSLVLYQLLRWSVNKLSAELNFIKAERVEDSFSFSVVFTDICRIYLSKIKFVFEPLSLKKQIIKVNHFFGDSFVISVNCCWPWISWIDWINYFETAVSEFLKIIKTDFLTPIRSHSKKKRIYQRINPFISNSNRSKHNSTINLCDMWLIYGCYIERIYHGS